jgi:hypothetical protein
VEGSSHSLVQNMNPALASRETTQNLSQKHYHLTQFAWYILQPHYQTDEDVKKVKLNNSNFSNAANMNVVNTVTYLGLCH